MHLKSMFCGLYSRFMRREFSNVHSQTSNHVIQESLRNYYELIFDGMLPIGEKSNVSFSLLQYPMSTQFSMLAPNMQCSHPRVPNNFDGTIESIHVEDLLNRHYNIDLDDVHAEEILHGIYRESVNKERVINENRLNQFVGGRMALRKAFKLLTENNKNIVHKANKTMQNCTQNHEAWIDVGPVLADAHGAPLLPNHIHGSISHKHHLALGLAVYSSTARVGCDIESVNSSASRALFSRILTPSERSRLGTLTTNLAKITMNDNNKAANKEHSQMITIDKDEEILLIFSLKESVFKALHSFLYRQIDWDEVEVNLMANGTATITFAFRSQNIYNEKYVKKNNRNNINSFRISDVEQGLGSEYEKNLNLQCHARWARYRDPSSSAEYWITFVHIEDISE